jgi:hypothetical protein
MQIKDYKIVIVLIICFITFLAINMTLTKNQTLKIALIMPPTSTDPMDHDYSIHHNTMRSVLASLISEYKAGEFTAQIAKKWTTNSDKTIWSLEIDPNWTFENGDKVTPQIVLKNFKRVLIIKNKSRSQSGLLEYLLEAPLMLSFDNEIKGLRIINNEIVFQFNKSMPDFLDKISFGLYSIAHPNDYDETTAWKNKKKVIASSYYKISNWTDKILTLDRRTDLHPEKINKKSISKVDFIFPNDMSEVENSQMIFNDRISPKIDASKWSFASSALDNKIIYVQVMNWEDKTSIFSNKEIRKKIRDIFYYNLEKSGMKPMTSFFPLSINGVSKFDYDRNLAFNYQQKELPTQPFTTTNYKSENTKKSRGDIFSEAYYGLCKDINAIPKINNYPEKSEDEKKVFDIQYLGTGISISSPEEDIRFMFKSKHGIMLPDESGNILNMLGNEFNIQKINKELWDQAIIWPVQHYSSGFWIKNDSKLDISDLNLLLTPTDLQFLKWE